VSPKQKNGGKYRVRHFVIFSVQNACGGFADIVLLCDGQGGVLQGLCVGNTTLLTGKVTATTFSLPLSFCFIAFSMQ